MTPSDIVIGLNTCIHRMHEGGYCDACTQRIEAIAAGRCAHCFTRPATETWVGVGGTLAFVHGFHERWCALCVARAQLKHCEEAAARSESLRAEVARLEADPVSPRSAPPDAP